MYLARVESGYQPRVYLLKDPRRVDPKQSGLSYVSLKSPCIRFVPIEPRSWVYPNHDGFRAIHHKGAAAIAETATQAVMEAVKKLRGLAR